MSGTGKKTARIPETQPLSENEEAIIKQFHEKFGDRIQATGVSQMTLVRFVRGYKDDKDPVAKSLEMLEKMLKWREEQKVMELREQKLEKEDEFKQLWQSGVHGFGKEGHVVYYDRIGSVDGGKLMKAFTIEEITKFHIQMMEGVNGLKESHYTNSGNQPSEFKYKHIVVLDLKGIGMSHLGKSFKDPLKTFIHIDQDYYPESLYVMVICNAGWMVKAVWALASPFIDPITKENIKWGNDKLADYIEADQIPQFLGGKCKCPDGKCLMVPFVAGDKEAAATEQKSQ